MIRSACYNRVHQVDLIIKGLSIRKVTRILHSMERWWCYSLISAKYLRKYCATSNLFLPENR